METLFSFVSLALFALAILTFGSVVRDTFPFLTSEDQDLIRAFWSRAGPQGFRAFRRRDGVIGHAWNEHVRRFPNNRKRLFFAVFLVAAALSVMGYPLWLALSAR
jgi:hypothetical protein